MCVKKIVPFEYRASGLLLGRVSNQVRDVLYTQSCVLGASNWKVMGPTPVSLLQSFQTNLTYEHISSLGQFPYPWFQLTRVVSQTKDETP